MSNFLLEIGFEEFPPSFIKPAAEYIRKNFVEKMMVQRIKPDATKIFYTSSRIGLRINGFETMQPSIREKVQGAPKKIALDKDGNLSKAGQAFLNKYGLTDYFFEDSKKGEVITGWYEEEGKDSEKILLEIFDDVLDSIPFKKSMKWADSKLLFARPLKWILFLIDDKPLEHTFYETKFSKVSYGHRFLSPGPLEVTIENYEDLLRENYVIASGKKRREAIEYIVKKACVDKGGIPKIDTGLLEEVANTVEYPHAIIGDIPAKFISLPPELTTQAMKKHQKYFALPKNENGEILPHFISILNNIPKDDAVVKKGNEKVLLARLADSAFFYENDKKENFPALTEKLKNVVYQKDLGSYYDKIQRTAKIGIFLAEKYFDLPALEVAKVEKTINLMKNDLVTAGMAKEFKELQGVMGKYYALNSGADKEVALSVEEHYLPKFAGDKLPSTLTGKIVSMADRIDTIAGCFMAGLKPTGSKDKFAVRRNAISLLLVATSLDNIFINLEEVFDFASTLVKEHNSALEVGKKEILDFMKQRYYAIFDYKTTVVQSSIESGFLSPLGVKKRADVIAKLLEEKDIVDMIQLFKRSQNILKKADNPELDVELSLLSEDAENRLFEIVSATEERIKTISENFEMAKKILDIKPYLDKFFDDVMVMHEDEVIRNNRLNLINRVVKLVRDNIGDISYLNI